MQKTLDITTCSPDKTRLLGETIGRHLDAKTVIALTGGLGSGKTVFVQGLARGLAVPEGFRVTSPSYTLINEYPGRLRLFHVDLYRICASDQLEDTGLYEVLEQNGVIAVEWAEQMPAADLRPDIGIRIKMVNATSRGFSLFFYGRNPVDLLKRLKHLEFSEDKG